MSPAILKVSSPVPVRIPRGAIWAANAAVALLSGARVGWRWLAAPRASDDAPRSADELQHLASQTEREQPVLAWEVRAIARHLRTFENTAARRQPDTGGAR